MARTRRLVDQARVAVSPPPFILPDQETALSAAAIFAREYLEDVGAELRWEDDGGR